jgi:5-methylcytosine-specific restriction protein A
MPERRPYARTSESNAREKTMRKQVAPLVLKNLGQITSDRLVRGMQFVTVKPPFGPALVVWVKCAWKPGSSGTCAVQMAFPGKEGRAHTADDVIDIVVEKAKRASEKGATHLLLLAADNAGYVPLAAYMLSVNQIGKVIKQAVTTDESLTRNGASPSVYITAKGERAARLVEIVKNSSVDLLGLRQDQVPFPDAIEDLDVRPPGVVTPEKISRMSVSYARDPEVRSYVLSRANGRCEYCGKVGFLMADGKRRYLEAHHIIALANEGHDTIENVIALCPRHHREAHFGAKRASLESKMASLLKGRRPKE